MHDEVSYKKHKSVLLNEILELVGEQKSQVLDCTFGAGGYSRAILNLNPDNRVLACDCDNHVLSNVAEFDLEFSDRFSFYLTKFGAVNQVIPEGCIGEFDAILLDLGVSSMQLDIAERGFSFSKDADLDMRMDNRQGQKALDVINYYEEEELANIIFQYGEEHDSRRIARKIIDVRTKTPIVTTLELANIIQSVVGYKYRNSKIHPATKTFQALRIFVNDELEELNKILELSKRLLKSGGKLIVVSFHSLEDRIVKNFLLKNSGMKKEVSRISKYIPEDLEQKGERFFELPSRKTIKPSEEELSNNVRSRSARLRSATRL